MLQVGSLLEIWTGGAFKAVTHRVVSRSGRERYSTAFFRANALDTVCRPLLQPAEAEERTQQSFQSASGSSAMSAVLDVIRPVPVACAYKALINMLNTPGGMDAAPLAV
jgi:isopenicillin N synthase-like dioxygenase